MGTVLFRLLGLDALSLIDLETGEDGRDGQLNICWTDFHPWVKHHMEITDIRSQIVLRNRPQIQFWWMLLNIKI